MSQLHQCYNGMHLVGDGVRYSVPGRPAFLEGVNVQRRSSRKHHPSLAMGPCSPVMSIALLGEAVDHPRSGAGKRHYDLL